jgi:hypothetical protein
MKSYGIEVQDPAHVTGIYATAAEVLAGTEAAKAVAPLTITPILPNRNIIINGAMDIWQRGTTTLTNPADMTYLPDRFLTRIALGDGTMNSGNAAETPVAGFPFSSSYLIDCTNVETAVAAGELCGYEYRMEGFDFKRLEGETATLSFWFKAVKAGTYCVSFRNAAANKSYVHEYTIAQASTWEKKTVTLIFNSGETFLYTTGIGLLINWSIMCGTTKQIATANKDTWQAGNYIATDAIVNGLDSTANNFWLTGVQMELGAVATPFEVRPYQQELALCQRYYYRTASIADSVPYGNSLNITTGLADGVVNFPVEMRIAPTALEQSGTAAHYGINFLNTNAACDAVPTIVGGNSTTNGSVRFSVAGGVLTAGQASLLRSKSASGYLAWSAEL